MDKQCTKCDQTKPVGQFRLKGHEPGRKPRLDSWCKVCKNLYVTRYVKENYCPNKKRALMRTPTTRFNNAKRAARNRGYIWSIPFEVWRQLVFENKCHYCDGDLQETGCGLDRKENLIGYKSDNVVPCCVVCNSIKNSVLNYDEMVAVSNLLKNIRKANATS